MSAEDNESVIYFDEDWDQDDGEIFNSEERAELAAETKKAEIEDSRQPPVFFGGAGSITTGIYEFSSLIRNNFDLNKLQWSRITSYKIYIRVVMMNDTKYEITRNDGRDVNIYEGKGEFPPYISSPQTIAAGKKAGFALAVAPGRNALSKLMAPSETYGGVGYKINGQSFAIGFSYSAKAQSFGVVASDSAKAGYKAAKGKEASLSLNGVAIAGGIGGHNVVISITES